MGSVRKIFGGGQSDKGYKQASKDMRPWRDFGQEYGLGGLKELMSGNVDLFALPGVMKSFDAGAESMQRRLSAQGYRGSGNELLSLADYTGDFTRDLYNQEFQRRLSIANLGYGASNDLASLFANRGRDAAAIQGGGVNSLLGLGGTIAGLFGICWVAEELYGPMSPKTYYLRSYLRAQYKANTLLGLFTRLYSKYGRTWAEKIKYNKLYRIIAKFVFNRIYRLSENK